MGKATHEYTAILDDSVWNTDYGTTNGLNFNQKCTNNVYKWFTQQAKPVHRINNRFTYPKAVIFVLLSKFFEAFAANGVRTVLALYLRDSLNFSEESSMTFYHIFNFFSQFCPIFGAILADSYLGNVRTIFYLFFLYSCGWIGMVILTLPLENVPIGFFVITSLILISIGNGSIRACVTSLGGSQFELPTQSKALNQYFSHYYFIYTLGILLAKIVPPEIRAHTTCFGQNECYAAVFGSLAIIFLMAWLIFLMGLCSYKEEEICGTKSNILFQVIGCIYYAIKQKLIRYREKSLSNHLHESWIDVSTEKYSESFVEDVCVILKVLKLFIPLPMYWALFAQIDSSWTFQSTQLNTTIFGEYKIQADQAKAVGAVLLLILIPLWQNCIVPAMLIINLRITSLQSITMGGICAALSFLCAAILEFHIETRLHLGESEKISILWQLPQFLLIMLGEIWLSIPGLSFSFTQSPPSMRSVMTAAWFCNNAIGNLIVIGITELHPFKLQSNTYFLYAVLMFSAILLFIRIAGSYKYTNSDDGSSNSNNLSKRRSSALTLTSQDGLDLIF